MLATENLSLRRGMSQNCLPQRYHKSASPSFIGDYQKMDPLALLSQPFPAFVITAIIAAVITILTTEISAVIGQSISRLDRDESLVSPDE
jgi:hypothetical protein